MAIKYPIDGQTPEYDIDGRLHNTDRMLEAAQRTLVMSAICLSDVEGARKYLDEGVGTDVLLSNGYTPLSYAVSSYHARSLEMVHMLLQRGADPLQRSKDGKTAFDIAQERKDAAVLALLTSARDRKKEVLLECIRHGNVAQVREIFNKAFYKNSAVPVDWDCLHTALIYGSNREMLRLLITWGAKATAEDIAALPEEKRAPTVRLLRLCGLTRIGYAQPRPENTPAQRTRRPPKSRRWELEGALFHRKSMEHIRYLLDQGVDVSDVQIHEAVRYDGTDMLALLIGLGGDVDRQLKDVLKTPLHEAVSLKREEHVRCLLDHGADIDLADHIGRTPVDYARSGMDKADKKILKMLQQAAGQRSPHNLPKTLMQAIRRGDVDGARQLLDAAIARGEPLTPGAGHLKMALIREDFDMLRLLVNRGAVIDMEDLSSLPYPENHANYAELLHRAGMVICHDDGEKTDLKAGDIAPDGSIYMGDIRDMHSYNGRVDCFVMAEDLKKADGSGTFTQAEAAEAAAALQAHGHVDWQLPRSEVLRDLFNRKSQGALNGAFENKRYWSSSEHFWQQWEGGGKTSVQVRTDGTDVRCGGNTPGAVRAVRIVHKKIKPKDKKS